MQLDLKYAKALIYQQNIIDMLTMLSYCGSEVTILVCEHFHFLPFTASHWALAPRIDEIMLEEECVNDERKVSRP